MCRGSRGSRRRRERTRGHEPTVTAPTFESTPRSDDLRALCARHESCLARSAMQTSRILRVVLAFLALSGNACVDTSGSNLLVGEDSSTDGSANQGLPDATAIGDGPPDRSASGDANAQGDSLGAKDGTFQDAPPEAADGAVQDSSAEAADSADGANQCSIDSAAAACCCDGDLLGVVVCNADGTLGCPSPNFHVYYGADCRGAATCGGPCALPCADSGNPPHDGGAGTGD